MTTGDMVQKSCTASSNCTYRFMGSCGFGCGYDRYCDYQLPRDSRGSIKIESITKGKPSICDEVEE
jgi:hypothetical protein